MNQLSFASLDFAAKKKRTKRKVFLAENPQHRIDTRLRPCYHGARPRTAAAWTRAPKSGTQIQTKGGQLGRALWALRADQ